MQQLDIFREDSCVMRARCSMPVSETSSQPDSTTLRRLRMAGRLASSSSDTRRHALMSRCCRAGNLRTLAVLMEGELETVGQVFQALFRSISAARQHHD